MTPPWRVRARPGVLGLCALLLVAAIGPAAAPLAAVRPAKGKAQPKASRPAKAKRGGKPAKPTTANETATAGRKGKVSTAGKTATTDSSTWLFQKPANVVPNQQGKIVVFPFRNDDGDAISTQVGQLLEARGLEVVTGVRPVDSADQYRDVATHLGLTAFVEGDVRGTEARTRATIRLRSGFTGRVTAQIAFTESREDLPREISDKLWTKLGAAVARACVDADKPRKQSRTTLQINAGTPLD